MDTSLGKRKTISPTSR